MTREYPREVRRAWERLQAAQEARRQIDDANNELQARYARENFLRALFYLNPSEIPDSVREARRRFDEDLEDHDEAIRAGDPVANARNQELMRQATDAECAAGIHRFCACRHGRKRLDATPPDEADPVTGNWFDERNAQVWGVIQSDGSVVAKGFVGDETADEDKAVHPAGSLAYYSPQRGWTNAATGHPASEGPATPPGQETDMPRHDRFGDRGPRGDRDDVADTFANQPIGSTMTLYRLDGTEASYRLTPAGGRMIPGSDTKANARAEVERDLAAMAAEQRRAERETQEQPKPDPAPPPTPTPSRPSAAPTTGSAGGNVASIEEVRAGIAAANEKATEGLGALQQAHASLEQAQGTRATEGSGQADVSEANGMLAQAVVDIEELRQKVSAAISSAEDVGNRL